MKWIADTEMIDVKRIA